MNLNEKPTSPRLLLQYQNGANTIIWRLLMSQKVGKQEISMFSLVERNEISLLRRRISREPDKGKRKEMLNSATDNVSINQSSFYSKVDSIS